MRAAIDKVANTGRIGKPLLTLHGTLDTLLPIRVDSDVYARKVAAAGAGALHRYYVIDKGNHVDGRYDAFPDRLRPMLPCHRTAFVALERWVEQGAAPPDSQFVPKPAAATWSTRASCAAAASGRRRPDRAGRPGAPPARAPARDGHAAARPRAARSASARAAGSLRPAGVSAAAGCRGTVTVQVKAGRRTISARRARLRADLPVRLARDVPPRRAAGRGRLKFVVRFSGNRAVAPGSAADRVDRRAAPARQPVT